MLAALSRNSSQTHTDRLNFAGLPRREWDRRRARARVQRVLRVAAAVLGEPREAAHSVGGDAGAVEQREHGGHSLFDERAQGEGSAGAPRSPCAEDAAGACGGGGDRGVVAGANRIGGVAQRRGRQAAVRKEVDDAQFGVAPAPSKVDTTSDRRVVARRVRVEFARLDGACEEIAAAGGGMNAPVEKPTRAELLALCRMLGGARLLLVELPRAQRERKIRLNMQLDDVYFALQGDATVGILLRQ